MYQCGHCIHRRLIFIYTSCSGNHSAFGRDGGRVIVAINIALILTDTLKPLLLQGKRTPHTRIAATSGRKPTRPPMQLPVLRPSRPRRIAFWSFPYTGRPVSPLPSRGSARLKGNRWPRGDAHTLSHDQTYAFIVIPSCPSVIPACSPSFPRALPSFPRTREPRAIKTTVPSRPSPTPVRYRGNGVLCFSLDSRVRGNDGMRAGTT